jgi:hypothetical protein
MIGDKLLNTYVVLADIFWGGLALFQTLHTKWDFINIFYRIVPNSHNLNSCKVLSKYLDKQRNKGPLISQKELRSIEFKVTNNTKFITNFVNIAFKGFEI